MATVDGCMGATPQYDASFALWAVVSASEILCVASLSSCCFEKLFKYRCYCHGARWYSVIAPVLARSGQVMVDFVFAQVWLHM